MYRTKNRVVEKKVFKKMYLDEGVQYKEMVSWAMCLWSEKASARRAILSIIVESRSVILRGTAVLRAATSLLISSACALRH